jgi:hypothetical protein
MPLPNMAALREVSYQYRELAERLARLETGYKKQFQEIYKALNFEKKQTAEDFNSRRRPGFTR